MKIGILGTLAAVALLAAGCGGDTTSDTHGTADQAGAIKEGVSYVTKTVELDEDNDPNELLGRPNGYTAATVFYDSRADCEGLGVDCGATLEEWPSASAAQDRADYIKSLGSIANEYDYVDGALVLRVSGALKPSDAKEYETAFGS